MKQVLFDNLEGNPAFGYMLHLGHWPISTYAVDDAIVAGAVAARARAALLRGFPAQDVLGASLGMYQHELLRHEGLSVEEIPVPHAIAQPFLEKASQYKPSPIDTSHVVLDDKLKDAATRIARSVHEDWRTHRAEEGLTEADTPLMKPWEDLSDEQRSPSFEVSIETVKTIAALGGVAAAELLFEEVRDEILRSLDANTHDVWARQKMSDGTSYGVECVKNAEGRDVTHPDLLDFNDLSEATKAYDHAANIVVLDTLRKEGIDIEPQVSEAVKETEKMFDAVKRNPAKEEVKGAAKNGTFVKDNTQSHLAQSRKDDIVRSLADAALLETVASRGPKEVLPGPQMFREVIEKMGPLTEDIVDPSTNKGIFPKGMRPFVESDESVSVKMITFDGEEKEFCPSEEILDMIVENGLSQGISILPFQKKFEHQPLSVRNLADDDVARTFMEEARCSVDLFFNEGFSLSGEDFFMLSLSDNGTFYNAIKERYPEHTDVIDLIKEKGMYVAYDGKDETLLAATQECLIKKCLSWDDFRFNNGMNNRIAKHLDWAYDRKRTPEIIQRMMSFAEQVKTPGTKEHIMILAAKARHNGHPVSPYHLMMNVRQNLTGCSIADAESRISAAKPEKSLVDSIRIITKELNQYRKDIERYENRNFIGKLFNRAPVLPPMAKHADDRFVDVQAKIQESADIAAAVRVVTTNVRDDAGNLVFDDAMVTSKTEALQEAYRGLGNQLYDAVRDVPGLEWMQAKMASIMPANLVRQQQDSDRMISRLKEFGLSSENIETLRKDCRFEAQTPAGKVELEYRNGEVLVGPQKQPIGQALFEIKNDPGYIGTLVKKEVVKAKKKPSVLNPNNEQTISGHKIG